VAGCGCNDDNDEDEEDRQEAGEPAAAAVSQDETTRMLLRFLILAFSLLRLMEMACASCA
jgi:hypothetical protein